jgi:hypothetical protein
MSADWVLADVPLYCDKGIIFVWKIVRQAHHVI